MDTIIVKTPSNADAIGTALGTVTHRIIGLWQEGYRVFLLSGDLGAGKTTLVQEVMRQLGVTDPVSSPTYALVNEYESNNNTYFHFDLYRLQAEEELYDLGFEDYLATGDMIVIEWPEIAMDFLPRQAILIEIKVSDDHRQYHFNKLDEGKT